MRFEDKAGDEEVYFQAEKNHVELVKNDETRTIGHDWIEDVGNDATQSIGHDRHRKRCQQQGRVGGQPTALSALASMMMKPSAQTAA